MVTGRFGTTKSFQYKLFRYNFIPLRCTNNSYSLFNYQII